MKYVLLMMGNLDGPTCGEENAPGEADFIAYDAALSEAGVLAGGFALDEPATATSLTKASRDDEAVITAGPYAESREFVGGTVIIDVPTMDDAIEWAKRCPGAIGGRVEIRPLVEY